MEYKGSVLTVEPNGGLSTTLEILLKKHFGKVISVVGLDEMFAVLDAEEIDVLVLDLNLCTSGNGSGNLVENLVELYPNTEIVLLTSLSQATNAVAQINAGATDYITKPWNNDKLVITVKNAMKIGALKKEVGRVALLQRGLKGESDYFWGISSVMKKVYATVHQAAYTDTPVLVNGELGCGKEKIAAEIHAISKRSDAFFMVIDADAIPEEMFALNLVGKCKNGEESSESVAGKLELAQGGTLFINNVDKLSLPNQKLLLDIIKTNTYSSINSNISSIASSKFIFGSSSDLEKMTLKGEFLEELYNRINIIKIELPPLRGRRDDILPLASVFLDKYNKKFRKKIKGFNKAAMEFLTSCNWPGNVSELAATIEKAVILCDMSEITPAHLQSAGQALPDTANERYAPDANLSLLSLIGENTLEQIEKKIIKAVLLRNRGNMSLTAKQLGITRQTLYNKGEKYGLID